MSEEGRGINKARAGVAAIAPNWLGDLVMATSAVRALRRALPRERLDLFAPQALAELARAVLPADRVFPFRLRKALRRLGDRLRLASAIRARGYRTVVLFPNSLGSAFVAALSRTPERVGAALHGRSALLTKRLEPPGPGEHHADAFVRIAEAAAGGKLDRRADDPRLTLPGHLRERAASLLRREGLDPARERFLVMAPGHAGRPAKRYGAGGLAEVARAAAERGLRPVIDGSPAEVFLCREVAGLVEDCRPVVTAGKTSLLELAGMLALADAFVGNDSGAAHLAASLGTPTVAIFLSTDPESTAPRGENVRVLASDVECRPCLRRTCPLGTYACRRAVAPGEVVRALDELGALAGKGDRGG